MPTDEEFPTVPTADGTADRNRSVAAAVPVPVVRGTAPVPGSTPTGTTPTIGTDHGSNRAGTDPVPGSTPRGTGPVPGSIRTGTVPVAGSTPRGTDPTAGTDPSSTQTGTAGHGGTGHGSAVPIHRDHRFHLPLIDRNRAAAVEPTGTGTDGHGSSSSSTDATAKGAKHASGDAKRWAFLAGAGFWLWVAILAVNAVAVWMSADGTLRGWKWSGLNPADSHRFGLPVISEGMVIAWLLVGQQAIRMKRSPYPWWGVAAGFAGIAVLLNTAFSSGPHPHREAAIFGVASTGSLALTFVKFYLSYVGKEVDEGLRAGAKPKVLLNIRTIEQPRIRWRAHLITGRIGSKAIIENGLTKRVPLTLDDVIALADLWCEVYQDYRAKKDDGKRGDKQLAKRTAWDAVKAECGVKVIERKTLKADRIKFVKDAKPEPEKIETVEEALVMFKREMVNPPAGPKPPRMDPPRPERPTNAPTSPAPSGAASSTPLPSPEKLDEWLKQHYKHINLVQEHVPDWKDRELPVDEIQDLGKRPELAGKGLANRGNATRIAACMRSLRAEADQASK